MNWPRRSPMTSPAADSTAAGYFGKLPDRGDFVAARIDRPLRERLDDIEHSKSKPDANAANNKQKKGDSKDDART